MAGPVLKRGKLLRSWNKRYMTLWADWQRGFELVYSKWSGPMPEGAAALAAIAYGTADTSTETTLYTGEQRGSIRLSQYMRIEASQSRQHGFKLVDDSGVFEGMALATATADSSKVWADALARCVGQHRCVDVGDLGDDGALGQSPLAQRAHKTLSAPLHRARPGSFAAAAQGAHATPAKSLSPVSAASSNLSAGTAASHASAGDGGDSSDAFARDAQHLRLPGTLYIRVLGGDNMKQLTGHATAEPFIAAMTHWMRIRSRVASGGTPRPQWNETLAVPVSHEHDRFITLDILDQDARRGSHDHAKFLARAVLPLAQLGPEPRLLVLPLTGRTAEQARQGMYTSGAKAQELPAVSPTGPTLLIRAWHTLGPCCDLQDAYANLVRLPMLALSAGAPVIPTDASGRPARYDAGHAHMRSVSVVPGPVPLLASSMAAEGGARATMSPPLPAGHLLGEMCEDVASVILRPFSDSRAGVFPGTLVLTNFRLLFLPATVDTGNVYRQQGAARGAMQHLHLAWQQLFGAGETTRSGSAAAAAPQRPTAAAESSPIHGGSQGKLGFSSSSYHTHVTVDNRSGFEDHGSTMTFQIPLRLIRRLEMRNNNACSDAHLDASGRPRGSKRAWALSGAFTMAAPDAPVCLVTEHFNAVQLTGEEDDDGVGADAVSPAAIRALQGANPGRNRAPPHLYMQQHALQGTVGVSTRSIHAEQLDALAGDSDGDSFDAGEEGGAGGGTITDGECGGSSPHSRAGSTHTTHTRPRGTGSTSSGAALSTGRGDAFPPSGRDGPQVKSRVHSTPLPSLKLSCDHFATPRFVFQSSGPAPEHAELLGGQPDAAAHHARAPASVACSRMFRRLLYVCCVQEEHEELLVADARIDLASRLRVQLAGNSSNLEGATRKEHADSSALAGAHVNAFGNVQCETDGDAPVGDKVETVYTLPDRVVSALTSRVYDPQIEAARQCISPAYWRCSTQNRGFDFCSTYPPFLFVPRAASDELLKGSAAFRSRARLPVLTWHHPANGATICRCAQPLTGLRSTRSAADEELLELIRQASPRPASEVIILDARPKLNAQANAVQGKGYESTGERGAYKTASLFFMDIENIHVMRRSLALLHSTAVHVPETVLTNARLLQDDDAAGGDNISNTHTETGTGAVETPTPRFLRSDSGVAVDSGGQPLSRVDGRTATRPATPLTARLTEAHAQRSTPVQAVSKGGAATRSARGSLFGLSSKMRASGNAAGSSSTQTPEGPRRRAASASAAGAPDWHSATSATKGSASSQNKVRNWLRSPFKRGANQDAGGGASGPPGVETAGQTKDFMPKMRHKPGGDTTPTRAQRAAVAASIAGSDSQGKTAMHTPPLPFSELITDVPDTGAEAMLQAVHTPMGQPGGDSSLIHLPYSRAARPPSGGTSGGGSRRGSGQFQTQPPAASESSRSRRGSSTILQLEGGHRGSLRLDDGSIVPLARLGSTPSSATGEGGVAPVTMTAALQRAVVSAQGSHRSSSVTASTRSLLRGFHAPPDRQNTEHDHDHSVDTSAVQERLSEVSEGVSSSGDSDSDSIGGPAGSHLRSHTIHHRQSVQRNSPLLGAISGSSPLYGASSPLDAPSREGVRSEMLPGAVPEGGGHLQRSRSYSTLGSLSGSPILDSRGGALSSIVRTAARGAVGSAGLAGSPLQRQHRVAARAAEQAQDDGTEAGGDGDNSAAGGVPQCVVLGPHLGTGLAASHIGAAALQDIQQSAAAAVLKYAESVNAGESMQVADAQQAALHDHLSAGAAAASSGLNLSPKTVNDAAAVAAMGDAWSSALLSLSGQMAVSLGILGNDSNWLPVQDSSGWLRHASLLIAAAVRLTRLVDECGFSVVVHCSDGWDRTTQIVALAQLMLDPYFRTFEGFAVLVEKEWCAFGHKLQDRSGRGVGGRASQETSPIFLQWLDAVQQLQEQLPWAFEFNSAYLAALGMLAQACWFDNMLCNTPQQRFEMRLKAATSLLAASTCVVVDANAPGGERAVPHPQPRTEAHWAALLAVADAMPCMWRHLWAHRAVFQNARYMSPDPSTMIPMLLPADVHVVHTHGTAADHARDRPKLLRRIWQRSQVLQPQHSPRCLTLWAGLYLHWGRRVREALCQEAQWVLQSLAYVPDEMTVSAQTYLGDTVETDVSITGSGTGQRTSSVSSIAGAASIGSSTGGREGGLPLQHLDALHQGSGLPTGATRQARIAARMGSSRASIAPNSGLKRLIS